MKTDWIGSKKTALILAIFFVLGIIFLVGSEYISTKRETAASVVFDENAYTENLEARLSEMIRTVCGSDEVKVMITLEGSAVYCYAQEQTESEYAREKSLLLQQDKNGAKTPILTEISAPKIKGVSVVCKGGKDSEMRKEIINLIAGTLHLSTNRIYVTE